MLDLTKYSYDQLEAMSDLMYYLRGEARYIPDPYFFKIKLRRDHMSINNAICATLDIMAEEWDHRQEDRRK